MPLLGQPKQLLAGVVLAVIAVVFVEQALTSDGVPNKGRAEA
jgi:hypothetical protein